ncbi:MAG: hypothetical protein ACTSPY_01520 [Candidatus Helarchaeota archaeon]
MKRKNLLLIILISIALICCIFNNFNTQNTKIIEKESQAIHNPNIYLKGSSFSLSGNVSIYIGSSVLSDELYQLISYDLKIKFSTAIIKNDSKSLVNNSIVIGRPEINQITNKMVLDGNISLQLDNLTKNSYQIINVFYNSCDIIVIAGKDNLGDAYGTYWFIEYYLKLHSDRINGLNITRTTELIYRRSGISYTYQSNFSNDPPYITKENMDKTFINFKSQINFSLRTGINMFNMGSFLKCLNFDNLEPGNPYVIYDATSPYRARHNKYKEIWNNLTSYAKRFNFTVITSTDMFPYTPPIKDYLNGKLSTSDPKLWAVINASIFEIFSTLSIDGIQVRIGEGGEVGSGDYTSSVIFKGIDNTKLLIRRLLSYIDNYNSKYNTSKFLLFRTWTIGIGSIGDLHIDPNIYHQVFDEFDNRSNLIVSIKHVAMDFFHYVPRNPTIGIGNISTIVEFQSAREYEGYGNYPNYLAKSYQEDLKYFSNFSNFKGVWIWTGYAGWYKGQNIVYKFKGFYIWQDANVYAYMRLNWNHSDSILEITQDWIKLNIGNNSKLITNFTNMLLISESAVIYGLYINDFAKYTLELNTPLFSIGRLPTMLWVYWGIPTSSHGILGAVYGRCRHNISSNVNDGFIAINMVKNMSNFISGFENNVSDSELYTNILFSLQYQEKVFTMLAWYRQLFLYYYDYTTTLNINSYYKYIEALPHVKAAITDYMSNWDSYANFSRYEVYEMQYFIQRVEINYPTVLLISRIIFTIIISIFIFGIIMSFYYRNGQEIKNSKKLKFIINGALTFQNSILNPWKFFTKFDEKKVSLSSFIPMLLISLVISLAITGFNYFEGFQILFSLSILLILLSWIYFSGMFFILSKLFQKKNSEKKITFLKVLATVQYFYMPIVVYVIILFGLFSIYGPQIVWYYLIRSIIYFTPLLIAIILCVLLFIWLLIVGFIGIIKMFNFPIWKAFIIIFSSACLMSIFVYFYLMFNLSEIIVFLNNTFNIITTVFNSAETSASQFF